jgi:hypothetical protein
MNEPKVSIRMPQVEIKLQTRPKQVHGFLHEPFPFSGNVDGDGNVMCAHRPVAAALAWDRLIFNAS